MPRWTHTRPKVPAVLLTSSAANQRAAFRSDTDRRSKGGDRLKAGPGKSVSLSAAGAKTHGYNSRVGCKQHTSGSIFVSGWNMIPSPGFADCFSRIAPATCGEETSDDRFSNGKLAEKPAEVMFRPDRISS
jgi:hypothetical protein